MCPKFKPSIICINKLLNTFISRLMFSIHFILLTHQLVQKLQRIVIMISKPICYLHINKRNNKLHFISSQNFRCYQEPPANISRVINNSKATSVSLFICIILLRLRFYLKSVTTNSMLFVVCLFSRILIIHFRFESTHQRMINMDSSSLVNTSSCLFFFLRASRDALM